jgi:putative nucleotidyltransferase with HDIG domain
MKNTVVLPLEAHLLAQMAATPQNPRYHAEGNVLDHTALVLAKFEEYAATHSLSADDHTVYYWAALLHDIGKIKVTRMEGERWRSPGHERAGVPMAWDILLRMPEISDAQRYRILDLVRWHGYALGAARTGLPFDRLTLLGTRTDLRTLARFTQFDLDGRICEDRPWVDEVTKRFLELDVPRAEYESRDFASWQALFATWNLRHKNATWNALHLQQPEFLTKLAEAPQKESPETFGKKVYVTIGPPQSGKSTWLQANLPDIFRISLDEHELSEAHLEKGEFYMSRKLVEFKHFLVVYLNRYKVVALDGNSLHGTFRARLAEIIRGLNVELEYLVFEADLPTVLARNAAAESPRPEAEIRALYDRIDLIHPWEAHQTRYIRG